jgi:hypothetical protein
VKCSTYRRPTSARYVFAHSVTKRETNKQHGYCREKSKDHSQLRSFRRAPFHCCSLNLGQSRRQDAPNIIIFRSRLLAGASLFEGFFRMALSIDGHAVGSYAGNSCTLTTANAGDIIVALGYQGNGIVSMSDTAGLSWNTVLNVELNGYYALIAWAYSASTLSSDVISCGTGGYTLDAVAVAGANISPPIDADSPADSTSSPFNLNTASANTLIICAAAPSDPPSTAGSGFSLLDGGSANYFSIEYQIVSSAGSYSCSWGSGSPTSSFALAIVAASGGGGGAALASIAIPRKMFLPPKKKFYFR